MLPRGVAMVSPALIVALKPLPLENSRMVTSPSLLITYLNDPDLLDSKVINFTSAGVRPYRSVVRIRPLTVYLVARSYFFMTSSISRRLLKICTSLSTERRPMPPVMSANAVSSALAPLRVSFTSTDALRS